MALGAAYHVTNGIAAFVAKKADGFFCMSKKALACQRAL